METEQQIKEEYDIWKNNTHLLYDLVMTHSLEWPSLTVEWLPTVEAHESDGYAVHQMYFATHTADDLPNSVLKADIRLPMKKTTKKDVTDYVQSEFPTKGISGKLTITQRIPHDGDVNKLRYMPQNPSIVASKTAVGLINIFNTSQFPAVPASPEVIKTMTLSGHDNEGYALEWSKLTQGCLASGSDDHKICCWQVDMTAGESTLSPFVTYNERQCIIEDVAWHTTNASLLAAAGDDGCVGLYDIRQSKGVSLIHAHEKECNVVSFNPFNETLFMSASSDMTVALWDARNTSHALHFLEGHTDGIFSGVWSPHQASVLATSGLDRRVIIWDLNRIGMEQTAEEAEDGPAELLFIHGGHTSKVNDIAWNLSEEWMMASVADDNVLQVWEMASTIYDKKNEEAALDESLLD